PQCVGDVRGGDGHDGLVDERHGDREQHGRQGHVLPGPSARGRRGPTTSRVLDLHSTSLRRNGGRRIRSPYSPGGAGRPVTGGWLERWAGLARASPRGRRSVLPWTTSARPAGGNPAVRRLRP